MCGNKLTFHMRLKNEKKKNFKDIKSKMLAPTHVEHSYLFSKSHAMWKRAAQVANSTIITSHVINTECFFFSYERKLGFIISHTLCMRK